MGKLSTLEEQRFLSGLSEAWDWFDEFREAATKARTDLAQVDKQVLSTHERVSYAADMLIRNGSVKKETVGPLLKATNEAGVVLRDAVAKFVKALDTMNNQIAKR